jgi:hypothetical protein
LLETRLMLTSLWWIQVDKWLGIKDDFDYVE